MARKAELISEPALALAAERRAPAAKVPGPRRLRGLLASLGYVRDPMRFLLRMRERYGPGVVRVRLGPEVVYLLADPPLIEQVLITDSRDYKKDAYLRWLGDELLGQGLLSSEGDFWRRQRRLAQPAFHKERIAAYGGVMLEETERLAAAWRGGGRRDLHADMMGLTLAIVTRALFSSDVGEATAQVGEALDVLTGRYADPWLAVLPLLRRLPLPANRRFREARARIDEVVYGFIRRRRAEPAPRGDLLSMLIEARDEDGGAMSDQQLRDEVITLFLAGHETTALVLCYSFLLLGQHPAEQARLEGELRAVLGGRAPAVEDAPRLPVTEHVVLEAMRLYPPAWVLGREALREVELGGHRLPAGAQVAFAPWVVQRDARFFPEPERFRPERWEDGLLKRLPRGAYFPFGGGPRLCIGRDFALQEALLLLAALARRFRVRVERPEALRFVPSVTLRPAGPLWASVEEVAP